MSRVLVIPDLHAPFVHPKALQFVRDVERHYETNKTVFIGDLADNHSVSRFTPDPDGFSPGHELEQTQKALWDWHEAFPSALVCVGNHDERFYRKAFDCGLPRKTLKDYNDIFGTPSWIWDFDHEIDRVKYTHGTGRSGMTAALRLAIDNRQSTVIGHTHIFAGVQWHANDNSRIFGLNSGCLIDIYAYSMAYGRHFPILPNLGVGLVLNGQPQFLAMPCLLGEPYHRDARRWSWTKRRRHLQR